MASPTLFLATAKWFLHSSSGSYSITFLILKDNFSLPSILRQRDKQSGKIVQ